ncbi:MAG: phosphoribosylformylglycinamidine synthase subunit PurQ [Actinobacteria bacterium]|nr:phosphoribosylformylglycinamidine synthase subunit PurQ [Actinomycetota bacterium]
MKPRVAVVTFPGSLDDADAMRAVTLMGGEPVSAWHADGDVLDADAVVLPGGFSYGDYLRAGAIARFAPVMDAVSAFARAGGFVLGICNGFQILCEAGLLPGALIRNRSLTFLCRWIHVRTENPSARFSISSGREILQLPIKHGEGQFVASPDALDRIEGDGLVALRYCAPDGTLDDRYNPNGSLHGIAAVRSPEGNVLGMMPHPEHAVDPDLGPTGGHQIFQWLFSSAGVAMLAATGA